MNYKEKLIAEIVEYLQKMDNLEWLLLTRLFVKRLSE